MVTGILVCLRIERCSTKLLHTRQHVSSHQVMFMITLSAATRANMDNIPFVQCRFAMRYFSYSPPVFQRLFFTTEESSGVQYGPRRMKLRDLMAATLRFLQNDCATYRVLWDWSPCVSQLLTSDIMVRGYVPAAQARWHNFLSFVNMKSEASGR